MAGAIVGGIGLFLLGMILLTEGLKSAAGDALRRVLTQLTGGPLKALASGVAVTALVQSSSATTLTTIGFVSAGLLTLPQAIGVILGANLGTTSTGWLVSLIGFKLRLGAFALPLVGVGAMLRLAARGRGAAIGLAIAGFGLLFVGIDTLQIGMSGLAENLQPAALPGHTAGGRLLLVAIGVAMTVIMQSSSAALAATLAALHGGTIDLEQGAALVIGQNVGTTITAAFAAVGASVPARRTAVAHIAFNVLAGAVAFVLLPVMLEVSAFLDRGPGGGGAVTLAAFHTIFNLAGVLLLLPFVDRFAAAIVRLVPDRGPALTRHLDASLQRLVPVAIEAARRTLAEILSVAIRGAADALEARPITPARAAALAAAEQALAETRRFLGGIRTSPEARAEHDRHLAALHAADHVGRLVFACRERIDVTASDTSELRTARAVLRQALQAAGAWLDTDAETPAEHLRAAADRLVVERQSHRRALLSRTAVGLESPDTGMRELDAARWLERVAHHLWRAVHYLANGAPSSVEPEPEAPM